MASTLVSNSVANPDRSRDSSKRRKKKKTQPNNKDHPQNHNLIIKWKSESQQQIYSSKLIQALRHVRLGPSSYPVSTEALRRSRAMREAADRVLAVAAKGRTRWSRAILKNRLKLKFRKQKRHRSVSSWATGNGRSKKPRVSVLRLKGKCLPAVQQKVRDLGRLVPGCRKEPLPVILEEITDYIPALEMQIRAMTSVLQLFSAGSTSGAGPTSGATS